MTVQTAITDCPAEFAHSALVVGSDEDLRTALAPQVRRCLARDEEVLLVVGDRTRAVLADELPEQVRWAEPAAYYQRLGFAYESFRRTLASRRRGGPRLHVVAEPDLTGDRARAYLAYESICNDTYAPYDCPVTCIWDDRRHPAAVIDDVRATHTYELVPAGLVPSGSYLPPERYLAAHHTPPPAPPARVDHDLPLADVGELSALRATLTGWAAGHGFARQAADDVVVAAVEVATNGLRHAGGPVRVRAWRYGDTLIVQCDDAGGAPVPASAGYHRPDPAGAVPGGRGLWLARQLADVVTVESTPGATRVRLHFPYRVTHLDAG